MDLNYYESGYIEAGYLVYTADAISAIESTSTINLIISVVREAQSSIESSFTQSCTISHIEGADLFAFTEASLAAQVDRIRDVNTSVSGVFSTAIDGTRGIYVSAQADAVSLIDIYNTRIRDDEAALDAAFSLSADGTTNNEPINAEAILNSEFAQTTTADKLSETSVNFVSESTQVIVIEKITGYDAILLSITSQDCYPNLIKETACQLSSEFTQTNEFNRTREFASDENSLFSPNVICNAIKNSFAVLDSPASLDIVFDIFKETNVNIESTTTTIISISINVDTNALITTSATLNAYGYRTIRNLPDPTIESGGLFNTVSISNSITKFGIGSLQYDPTLAPASRLYTPIVYGSAGYVSINRYIYTNNIQTVFAYISTDGINWQRYETNIPPAYDEYTLKYLNNKYTVYRGSKFWTSTDAVNWTEYTASDGYTTQVLTYNNGLYIRGVNSPGYTDYIQTSTNLTTWTNRYSYTPTNITFSRSFVSGTTTKIYGYYSAGTPTYYTTISTSTNGTTWTTSAYAIGTNSDSGYYEVNSVASNGSAFIHVTGKYIKTNANTTISSPIANPSYKSIIWNNSQFLIYGTDTVTLNEFILTSSNGSTFSLYNDNVQNLTAESNIRDSDTTYLINGKYFAGTIGASTSNDGLNWTAKTLTDYNVPQQPARIIYPANADWNNWKTIDFWFNSQATTNDTLVTLGNFEGWRIYSTYGASQVRLVIVGYDNLGIYRSIVTALFNLNEWHHVRFVYNNNVLSSYLDGVRSNTSAFGTGWQTQPTDLPLVFYADSNQRNNVNFDEFLITKDVLVEPTVTSFTVPTQPWTNTVDTSLLLPFDTSFSDDPSTNLRFASAGFTSTITLYADVDETSNLVAALQSNFVLTADVSNIKDSQVIVNSEFNSTIVPNRIKSLASTLTSEFTQTTNARLIKNLDVSIVSEFTQTTTAFRTQEFTADFAAFYTELTVNGRIRADVADLDVIASLNSTASKFNGATISLDSIATQTADVTRIKPLAANLTDAFNFVATCISDIEAQATIESTTSAEINASRIRDVDAEFTAFYTELTVNTRTRDELANLTSTFNINAIINLTSENTVNASSQASLNAIAVRAKGLSSVQELTSTLSATATRTASLVSQQAATTSESIEYIRYRNFDATFTAFYTELTVNSRIRAEVADLDCEFTIYAKGNVQGANASDMESTVSITAQSQRTRNIVSNQEVISSIIVATGPVYRTTVDLDAVISQTSEVDKTTDVVINLQAFNTQVTANARTRNEVASLVTTSTMAITAVRAKGLIAPLTAQITETAIATRIKPLVSAMNAITAMTVVGGKSVQAQANLQAYFTPVINTNIIHITAELTYVIPAELSEWIIGVDSRDWTISQETREYTI